VVDGGRSRAELEWEATKARLLLEAARYLNETLEPKRVYERFHEILADAVQHNGVVVSAYDDADGTIRCEFAWVDGELLAPEIFPPLELNREGGGMQSRVIVTGRPLLENNVQERVKGAGTYYDVDREGHVRKVPDSGPPGVQAALMVPAKDEGRVVGVVQLMSDRAPYTEEQLELVEGLVGQMAAAIRNARLAEAAASARAAEAAAAATAAEREHAARVLEAVADGIFLLDDAGVVRFWNPAAELATGLPRERAIGRPIEAVIPIWRKIAQEVPIAEGGAPAREVTLPVDVGGRELWLAFAAVRSPEGVVYAFRDLTQERRLDEAKSDFVAAISHELRTPLTGVLGAARTLLRADVALEPELRDELLEMIAAQADRLRLVADEVLLASSIDSGTLQIAAGEVDMPHVVRETVGAMRPRVPESLSLVVRTSPGKAVGDSNRIQQVLVNLIDNAIKYSPTGGTILVSTKRLRNQVRTAVRDPGLGIPPLEQARVFDKFYRGDPAATGSAAGTGLGLYICRELVERMGGQIRVRSEPQQGSTFYFDLPPFERTIVVGETNLPHDD
jgi:PAS domain S-box-containing protein